MVQTQGALWGLIYFSSTDNPSLVENFLQMRIQDVFRKIYKIINHTKYAIFTE